MNKKILDKMIEKKLKISFVESCTGGYLANVFTNMDNSSEVFEESYVCYSSNSKNKVLGVSLETIERYSVYSQEVCLEMTEKLYLLTKSNVCIATTGIAGNSHFYFNNQVIKKGTVFVGIKVNEFIDVIKCDFQSQNKSEFKEKVSNFVTDILEKMII